MAKDKARVAIPSLTINGADVTRRLQNYLISISYTEVAEGGSDTLSITLDNRDGKWMKAWYPQKGNSIGGKIKLKNWTATGKDRVLDLGKFTLDDVRFRFGPNEMELSGTSAPAASAFSTRDRDKTWKEVTLQEVAGRICKRYGLELEYKGEDHKIKALEQTENDGAFLKKACEDYGLSVKIYRDKVAVYDAGKLEDAGAVVKLPLTSFPTGLSSVDGLYGTYTGARVSYKPADGEDEITVFVGDTESDGKRVLKVNESCSSEAEARRKGAAKVNESNRKAISLSGGIFPDTRIVAGVCIELTKDFGKLSGKYFIDKVTWSLTGSGGTSQRIEAHKVVQRVS